MLCPVCKSELMITGKERLETLAEHVCDPNGEPRLKDKYECLNPGCKARGCLMWNAYGERYGALSYSEFVDNNDGPFGSFTRRANIEISKKDENHPLLGIETRWGQIRVVYKYEADDNGNILKRWRTYEIWKRDGNIGHRVVIPGIYLLWCNLKWFWRGIVRGQKLQSSDLFLMSWDKRWWRILTRAHNRFVARILRPAEYRKLCAGK